MRERDWDNEDDERIHETGEVGSNAGKLRPRERPCKSCPYRRDVPSGVWSAEEYVKLISYDGDTAYQDPVAFMCHQADGFLCAGWCGHRERASDLLAVRIGVGNGLMHPDTANYITDVPLFTSGADAALHGMRDIARPSPAACDLVRHLLTVRERRGTREEDAG
jgi:hypothetical protein